MPGPGGLPHADDLDVAHRGERAPVRAEGHGIHASGRVYRHARDFLAATDKPHTGGSIVAGRSQVAPVRAEGNLLDGVVVPQAGDLLAARDRLHPRDRAVSTCGQVLPVRTEGDGEERGAPLNSHTRNLDFAAAGGFPEPGSTVDAAGRHVAPVWAECGGEDHVVVLQAGELAAAGRLPDSGGPILVSRRDEIVPI